MIFVQPQLSVHSYKIITMHQVFFNVDMDLRYALGMELDVLICSVDLKCALMVAANHLAQQTFLAH